MRVAITGASGLIGAALHQRLLDAGHEPVPVVRQSAGRRGAIYWDPVRQQTDPAEWEGLDAVVNLAGESIASGRWNVRRKSLVRDSRVGGTQLIIRTLHALRKKPEVLINASAVGYYGPRPSSEHLDESSKPGTGFLSETCQEWESAALAARQAGVRVVLARMGAVLSRDGGALQKMLLIFRLGLGGRLGGGTQMMSWILLEDAVDALEFILQHKEISGPVNLTSPNPVSNAEFVRALGRVLRRPTPFPVPGLLLKLLLGEMAGPLLLTGQAVHPDRLVRSGFVFKAEHIEPALRRVLD